VQTGPLAIGVQPGGQTKVNLPTHPRCPDWCATLGRTFWPSIGDDLPVTWTPWKHETLALPINRLALLTHVGYAPKEPSDYVVPDGIFGSQAREAERLPKESGVEVRR
jgi:hypothetical protein